MIRYIDFGTISYWEFNEVNVYPLIAGKNRK